MLRPREDENIEDNPYYSLAAVDSMGNVGDNANLYYTSWISLGLATALVYQILGDVVQQKARFQRERLKESDVAGDVEAMLASLTFFQLETNRESRATWYQSVYRLRIRTGIWSATLMTTLLILISSLHIWNEVLVPTAVRMKESAKFQDLCSTLVDSSLPHTLCERTSFSLLSGLVAALLSFGAIVMHLLARRDAAQFMNKLHDVNARAPSLIIPNESESFGGNFLPLKSEFLLAVVLSNLLGLNAVFATGVQGPAATVGNLYYASWISFLLCLRISLGCLEQLCNIDEDTLEQSPQNNDGRYEPPSIDGSEMTNSLRVNAQGSYASNTDLMDNERANRTRRYFVMGISSTVCSASAYDAAMSQESELDMAQRYVIFAPSLVAAVCACQFLLCLQQQTYRIVSQLWLGGLISIFMVAICMATLIITMHTESSWAVNAIGEVQVANLYYFVWASMLTAGLQMASYVEKYLQLKSKDYTTVIWIAVVKVCFVILGAGYHIWHNIAGTCTLDDIRSWTVTFCSRTVLAIVVSFTGMIASALIAVMRVIFTMRTFTKAIIRLRAHLEMIVSLFLVLLFAAALALITGIGGPGESVGDLFYGTWLAFLIAIVLVQSCFDEIRQVDEVE
eukprot:CAMPEP_0194163504 /NCGR_PEP_ID=MMETSP0152-20130528/80078_1 /TAXON_ID=1049557 /ORGANISM="Thalassiothrix antarctica, Strain L6-D1" /LENGTH=623 /DNA_ID=CAMNT_0038873503 /DNA_START=639 /DNA_END=2510 /DNA_ORIENTATION=-